MGLPSYSLVLACEGTGREIGKVRGPTRAVMGLSHFLSVVAAGHLLVIGLCVAALASINLVTVAQIAGATCSLGVKLSAVTEEDYAAAAH